MGRPHLRLVVVPLLLAGLLAGGLALWGYWRFTAPGPSTEDVTLVLPRGSGLAAIAERLEDAGVVANSWLFRLGVHLQGRSRELKAGEYRFPAGISMQQAMLLLHSGKTVVRRLTIAEGLTVAEIFALVEAAEGLSGEIGPLPPEGTLLPETYHFSYGDDRAELVGRMRQAMSDALAELWAKRDPNLPLDSPEEALILASIVEKETAVPAERAHIAGVFINRLRRGMRLQSDPTVSYGITSGGARLERALSRKDLQHASPFNTYLIDGLPPHPIASPGRAALEAVMRPLATEDLYFVADGSGGHAFARTLEEHNRNVRKWRRLQKQGMN